MVILEKEKKVQVAFRFQDALSKKQGFSVSCFVDLDAKHITFISRKLYKEQELGRVGPPKLLTEDTFPLILEMAKEREVPYWYLMCVRFPIPKMSLPHHKFRYGVGGGSKNLRFQVASLYGPIDVEMQTKSEYRKEIREWIETYWESSANP